MQSRAVSPKRATLNVAIRQTGTRLPPFGDRTDIETLTFIDTSAVIAILAREPEAARFAQKIAEASRPISAGHVLLEASMRLASILRVEPEAATAAALERSPNPASISRSDRPRRRRKRRRRCRPVRPQARRKAELNFGDCLTYACARVHSASLLFKGDDFAATDAPST